MLREHRASWFEPLTVIVVGNPPVGLMGNNWAMLKPPERRLFVVWQKREGMPPLQQFGKALEDRQVMQRNGLDVGKEIAKIDGDARLSRRLKLFA